MANNTIYLYARSNTKHSGGGRNVQVAQSSDKGYTFGTFVLIGFEGAALRRTHGLASRGQAAMTDYDGFLFDDGLWLCEIYLFQAHPSPGPRRFSALFPATFRNGSKPEGKLRGGLFLSFSDDGVRWSRPFRLLESKTMASGSSVRTPDHPAGWHLTPSGKLQLQVEHNVSILGGDISTRPECESLAHDGLAAHQCRYDFPQPLPAALDPTTRSWA